MCQFLTARPTRSALLLACDKAQLTSGSRGLLQVSTSCGIARDVLAPPAHLPSCGSLMPPALLPLTSCWAAALQRGKKRKETAKKAIRPNCNTLTFLVQTSIDKFIFRTLLWANPITQTPNSSTIIWKSPNSLRVISRFWGSWTNHNDDDECFYHCV